jgi:hypothetical protein
MEGHSGKRRSLVRRAALGVAILAGLAVLLTLFWLRGALYNRLVRFPREEAAWHTLRAQRQLVTEKAGWQEYRGIMHSHSALSHDCDVPFREILGVLKSTGLDFICLSDHCGNGRADFSVQWRGLYDGKLFIPGFEMKEGIMPFGVAAGVVLSNRTEAGTLARQIVENGGVLFYAHPEEPRTWDRPELSGMEIYNIHRDFKVRGRSLLGLLPDLLLSQGRYPEQVLRLIFKRPTPFLERWDDLSRRRHLTGIAGNDCHQNVGLRGVCTFLDRVRLEDTSPKTLAEFELSWWSRPLLRACFGPLEPGRRLFEWRLDPYERLARFVNTHVLATELTEPAVLEALRAGRAFIGFDMIADSAGFLWLAENQGGKAVMGESLPFSGGTRLRARAPLPCRFTVLRDGKAVCQQEGRSLEWKPPGGGKYRIEAELKVLDQWVPWVYANPIELR